jgi:hypothetical protein
MRHFLTFTSCILDVAAFVLLLLASLSALAIKGIYSEFHILFSVGVTLDHASAVLILPYVTEDGHDVRIGVFGFCDTE